VGDALAGSDWHGLVKSVIRVQRDRLDRSAETGLWKNASETAYYVADFEPTAPFAAHAIRRHWGIENRLHYTRDGTMAEDASRVRKNPGIMARQQGHKHDRRPLPKRPRRPRSSRRVHLHVESVEQPCLGTRRRQGCCERISRSLEGYRGIRESGALERRRGRARRARSSSARSNLSIPVQLRPRREHHRHRNSEREGRISSPLLGIHPGPRACAIAADCGQP
jgi:hypothetical protein